MRRPLRLTAVTVGVALALRPAGATLGLLRRAVRSWPHRVAVAGPSMAPALVPGDWLLVDPAAYRRQPPVAGQIVVVPDPRLAGRLLVKRIRAVTPEGLLDLRGDAADASTDSRTFGPLPVTSVAGRAWARYWPLARLGRVR